MRCHGLVTPLDIDISSTETESNQLNDCISHLNGHTGIGRTHGLLWYDPPIEHRDVKITMTIWNATGKTIFKPVIHQPCVLRNKAQHYKTNDRDKPVR